MRYGTGIAPRSTLGTVEIRSDRKNDRLVLEIRDDGPGVSPESNLKDGVGISSTRARLEKLYGAAHQFELRNAAEGGLVVTLTMPVNDGGFRRAKRQRRWLLVKIRTLIVDDEPLGRERIRAQLASDSEVEVIEECPGRRAIAAIQRSRPDLVFLDVQMPEMDGFAVLDAIAGDYMPVIIFVTAYDRYAVQAFEVHALDYLLKSFDRDRFQAAVQRAKEEIHRSKPGVLNEKLVGLLEGTASVAKAFDAAGAQIGRTHRLPPR